MDIMTGAGLVFGIIVIATLMLLGGDLNIFVSDHAAIIIFGGSTAATMIGAASPTAIDCGAMATRAWACRSQPDSAANMPPAAVRSARAVSRTSSGWRRSKARWAALW